MGWPPHPMCSGLSSSGMVRDTAGTGAIGTVRRRHRQEVREGPEDQVTPVDLAGSAAAVRGAEDHVAADLAAAVVSEAPSAAAAAEASAVPAAVALVGASAVVAEASVAVAEASEVALAAAVAAAADLAGGASSQEGRRPGQGPEDLKEMQADSPLRGPEKFGISPLFGPLKGRFLCLRPVRRQKSRK